MSTPSLYLELAFRSGFENDTYLHEDRNDDSWLYVPISYVWQEGPLDFHVHFHTASNQHTEPFIPLYDGETGDYIAPDPSRNFGYVRAYHIGVCSKPKYGNKEVADEKYISRLMDTWESPCCSNTDNPQLEAYLAPRKKVIP